MLTILAGKLNEGKTNKLLALHKELGGDGFACVKVYKDDVHIGYNFMRLSSRAMIPFMVEKQYVKNTDLYDSEFKKYCYSQKALDKVLLEIKHLIKEGVSPLYLDEIGLLELEHRGNDEAFRLLLKGNKDVYVCVRDKFVPSVIKNYHIKNFKIVGVK